VCPWNGRFARPTPDTDLAARALPDPAEFSVIDAATFDLRFAGTAFSRPGHAGMRRNAAAIRPAGARDRA
jgi:epoxyqueuosine reductase QueG